jgi:hypothetical protein
MDFMELMKRERPAEKRTPTTNSVVNRSLFVNVEQLEEAATTYSPSTGNLTITVIKPGWSKNNRYYSAELLKSRANIFENAKMFMNHATDAQAKQRPEGDVRDWVGTITGVHAESDGTLKATVNVHDEAFKTNLGNLKKAGNLNQMGVSIRAFGEAKDGEAAGRKGKIIESLLGCKSVDFVTFAGAGGQVESMSEAVDPDDVMLLSLDDLKTKRPDLVEALTSVKETSSEPIKKKASAVDRFIEGNPLNQGDRPGATPNTRVDKLVAKKEKLVERMVAKGMDPREARGIVGLKEALPEGLDARQSSEYTFARRCGISEADALVLAKMPLRTKR